MSDKMIAEPFHSILFTTSLNQSNDELSSLLTDDWSLTPVFEALNNQSKNGRYTIDVLFAVQLSLVNHSNDQSEDISNNQLEPNESVNLSRDSSAILDGVDEDEDDDGISAISALSSPIQRSRNNLSSNQSIDASARIDEALTASSKRDPTDPLTNLSVNQSKAIRAISLIIRDHYTYLPNNIPVPASSLSQSESGDSEESSIQSINQTVKSVAQPREADALGFLLVACLIKAPSKSLAQSIILLIEQLGLIAQLNQSIKLLISLVEKPKSIELPPNLTDYPIQSINLSNQSTDAFVTNFLTPLSFSPLFVRSINQSIDVINRFQLRPLVYRLLDSILADNASIDRPFDRLVTVPSVYYHIAETPMFARFTPFRGPVNQPSDRLFKQGYTWHMFVSLTGARGAEDHSPNILRFFSDTGAGIQVSCRSKPNPSNIQSNNQSNHPATNQSTGASLIVKLLPAASDVYPLKNFEFVQNQWVHLAVTHAIVERRAPQPTAVAVKRVGAHSPYPSSAQMRTQSINQSQYHSSFHSPQQSMDRSVSHSNQSTPTNIKLGRLTLFVNGEAVSVAEVPFPNFESVENLQLSLGGFYGRIGSFALFDDALHPNKVAALYAAGGGKYARPSVHVVHRNQIVAVVSPPPCATSSIAPASTQGVGPPRAAPDLGRSLARAIFVQAPEHTTNTVCLPYAFPELSENAPIARIGGGQATITTDVSSRVIEPCLHHMLRLDGVSVVYRVDNGHTFSAGGGLQRLLLSSSPSYNAPPFATDADISDLLTLMASLTLSDEQFAHDLLEAGAVVIKQLLLDHCRRKHKTLRLIAAIRKLILAVRLRDQTVDRSHFASFVSALVMDLSFWRGSHTINQAAIVRLLRSLVSQYIEPFCSFDFIGVSRIIDGIRGLYLNDITPKGSYFTPNAAAVHHPINPISQSNYPSPRDSLFSPSFERRPAAADRESPTPVFSVTSANQSVSASDEPSVTQSNNVLNASSGPEDLSLCTSLLDIAWIISQASLGYKAFERDCCQPILHGITACQASTANNPTVSQSLNPAYQSVITGLLSAHLLALLGLISLNSQRVLAYIHVQQGSFLLIKLLNDQSVNVRVLSIRILCHLSIYLTKRERVEKDKRIQLDLNLMKEHMAACISQAMKHNDQVVSSEELVGLFQILIGTEPEPLSINQSIAETMNQPVGPNHLIVDANYTFAHPTFLSMILELSILAPLDVQSKTLVDILTMLRANDENVTIFNQLFWARLLLPFISKLHFNPAANQFITQIGALPTPHAAPSPSDKSNEQPLIEPTTPEPQISAVTPHTVDQCVYHIITLMTLDAIQKESKGYQRVDQSIWCLNARENLLSLQPGRVKNQTLNISINQSIHDTWTLEMSLFYRLHHWMTKHVRLLASEKKGSINQSIMQASLPENQSTNVRKNIIETLELTEWLLFHSACSFLTLATQQVLGIRDVDKLPIAVRIDPNIDDFTREEAIREMLAANAEGEAQAHEADRSRDGSHDDQPNDSHPTISVPQDDQPEDMNSDNSVVRAAQRSPIDEPLTSEEIEIFTFVLQSINHFNIVDRRQEILRVLFRYLLIVLPSAVCAPLTQAICAASRTLFTERITEKFERNSRLVALTLNLLKQGMSEAIRRQDLSNVEVIKRTIGSIYLFWGEMVFTEIPTPNQFVSSVNQSISQPMRKSSMGMDVETTAVQSTPVVDQANNPSDQSATLQTVAQLHNLNLEDHITPDAVDEAAEACLYRLYQGEGAAIIAETQKLFLKHQMHFNFEYEKRANKIHQSIYEWNVRQSKASRARETKFAEQESAILRIRANQTTRTWLTHCYSVKRVKQSNGQTISRATFRLNDREDRQIAKMNQLLKQTRRENSNSRPLPLPLPQHSSALITQPTNETIREMIQQFILSHPVPKPYEYLTSQSFRNAYSHSSLVEYWKLDSSEMPAGRMRRLLKKNFSDGQPHTFASAASHTGKTSKKAEQIDLMKVNLALVASHDAEQTDIDEPSTASTITTPSKSSNQSDVHSLPPTPSSARSTSAHSTGLDDDDDRVDEESEDEMDNNDDAVDDGTPRAKHGDKTTYSVFATMITPTHKFLGVLDITNRGINFHGIEHVPVLSSDSNKANGQSVTQPKKAKEKYIRWTWKALRNVLARYFLLRESAIEIFMSNGKNFFFHFTPLSDETIVQLRDSPHGSHALMIEAINSSEQSLIGAVNQSINHSINHAKASRLRRSGRQQRNEVYNELRRMITINELGLHVAAVEPARAFAEASSKVTRDWQRGLMSNFDYLMYMNTVAGRSFNDINQYPVFPWILTDYKSKTLDLTDPSIYRDLSLPIGALNEDRYEIFRERFETFEDDSGGMQPFLYGSHYSSAGIALHYLIRMEPFTSLAIALQGGHFDLPDRLFDSIAGSWDLSLNNMADVKELIPEFFYQPDFLRNVNGLDLGKKQGGTHLGDVQLPPWASSPEEFVRIHREALESDYVSAHLHEWIDLIFGYKQKGEAAVRAKNVFFYLTYHGHVDIDMIDNAALRKATEDQIANFGQTPMQLLTNQPHPRRLPSQERARWDQHGHVHFPIQLPPAYTSQVIHSYPNANRKRKISAATLQSDESVLPMSIINQIPRTICYTTNHHIVAITPSFSVQSHAVGALVKSSPTPLFPRDERLFSPSVNQSMQDPTRKISAAGSINHTTQLSSSPATSVYSQLAESQASLDALSSTQLDNQSNSQADGKLSRRGAGASIDAVLSARPTAGEFVPASVISSHSVTPMCPHWFLQSTPNQSVNTPAGSASASANAKNRALAPAGGQYRPVVAVMNRTGRFLFTGGYTDGSLKVHEMFYHDAHIEGLGGLAGGQQSHHLLAALATSDSSWERPLVTTQSTLDVKPHATLMTHSAPITALAISPAQTSLVTGDASGCIIFWRLTVDLSIRQARTVVQSTPPCVLTVHRAPIIGIAINGTFSAFITLVQDPLGQCGCEVGIYSVRAATPKYMSSIVACDTSIDWKLCTMTAQGHIVLYGNHANVPKLWLYSINGALLACIETNDVLSVLTVTFEAQRDGSPDRGFIVTGGRRGEVVFRAPHNLERVQTLYTDGQFPHFKVDQKTVSPAVSFTPESQQTDEWTMVDTTQQSSPSVTSVVSPPVPAVVEDHMNAELERVYVDPSLNVNMGVSTLDISVERKFVVAACYPDPDLVGLGLISQSNPVAAMFCSEPLGSSSGQGRLLLFPLPFSMDPDSFLGFYLDPSPSALDGVRDAVNSHTYARILQSRDAAFEALVRSKERVTNPTSQTNSANKAIGLAKTKVVGAFTSLFGSGKK